MVSDAPEIDWQPVVLAAGSSTRFGEADKLVAPLCGRPLLHWSLRAMASLRSRHPLVLVVPAQAGNTLAQVAADANVGPLVIVRGGDRRRDSVEAALRACTSEYAAIHDGARPLVTAPLLARLLRAAAGGPGAVPAVPATDTLVVIDAERRIVAHPDRASLVAVQTPQVVRRSLWLEAAGLNPADVTDDSAMLSRLGVECAVVEGDPANLKVTRPADIAVAEALLRGRDEPCSE